MQSKVLLAAAIAAVFAFGFLLPAHAKALSPTAAAVTNTTNQSVTVAPGDSLSSIATKYATTYIRLFDANEQIQSPDLIYPGQTIRIPTADEQLPDRLGSLDSDDAAPVSATVNAPSTATTSATVPSTGSVGSNVWTALAQCESGGNWSIDTGNGYYGGLQFTLSSWRSVGGSGYPNQASESEQISRAQALQARQGWGAWPVCSAKIGL